MNANAFPGRDAEQPIQYERLRHRRVSRRARVWLIVGLAICVGVWLWRSHVLPRAAGSYWMAQCAAYVAPPGQPVYEEHNDPAVQWTQASLESLPVADGSGTRRHAVLPRPLQQFKAVRPQAAPLFLGPLTTAAGERRTVVVMWDGSPPPAPTAPPAPQNLFSASYCKQIKPFEERVNASLDVSGNAIGSGGLDVFQLFHGDPRPWQLYFQNRAKVFRVYAGQRDPNDPSHFTIDIDADDKRLRLHGRLSSAKTIRFGVEGLSTDDDE